MPIQAQDLDQEIALNIIRFRHTELKKTHTEALQKTITSYSDLLSQYFPTKHVDWSGIGPAGFEVEHIVTQEHYNALHAALKDLSARPQRSAIEDTRLAAQRAQLSSMSNWVYTPIEPRQYSSLSGSIHFSEADLSRKQSTLKSQFIDFATAFLGDYSSFTVCLFAFHWNRNHKTEANKIIAGLKTYRDNPDAHLSHLETLINTVVDNATALNPTGSFKRRTDFLQALLSMLKAIDAGIEHTKEHLTRAALHETTHSPAPVLVA